MRVVVMGVSGCGKSSLGAALAERLRIPFFEGDALHPHANVSLMRSGTPLTDADRWPWLDRVAAKLADAGSAVVSCSALRHAYRRHIQQHAGGPVHFVHMSSDRELIAQRMALRAGHYMPLSLLDSQFATLEMPGPDEALTLDIALPLDTLLETAFDYLKGNQP